VRTRCVASCGFLALEGRANLDKDNKKRRSIFGRFFGTAGYNTNLIIQFNISKKFQLSAILEVWGGGGGGGELLIF
jgi:hypothetical protein